MAACDVLVNLRYADDGRDVGLGDPRALARQAALVSDVGWFAELPDDVALKVPGRRARGRRCSRRRSSSPPTTARRSAPRRATTSAREHDLGRVADAYVAALEVAAGGDAVDDAVLWRIAEAAAEVGLDDAAERSPAPRVASAGHPST